MFWLDAGPDADSGCSWVGWGEVAAPQVVHAARCPGDDQARGVDRFTGGWVGWIGYEPGAARAGAPVAAGDADALAERWLRVHGLVAFDHEAGRAWRGGDIDVDCAAPARGEAPARALIARSRDEPAAYAEMIARCRDAIRAGDAYQLCLTTRFAVTGDVDPIDAYLRLRADSPAHHGGVIRSGGVALLSASPERFVQVEGRTLRTRPIKGTRPRGGDAAADAAQAAELLASVKERAENIMIVDLMRNDLARVCEPGTVRVERLLEVESYPAVHQLVSTVSGRLPQDATVGQVLDGVFPAGSMTGAPKLSAMTLLHGIETGPRGVYAGCFGWIGAAGGLDLAMVIRSIVVHSGGAYVGAGGGITWRSDAAAEVAEVGLKARAPLAALGAAVPDGW
ncbi:hypothetical protein GCM10022240_23610 [Microbacterium kribbense]|uniref:Chorismate-utilising enzyme C-terminal domain-containing protein n=1 Tax=Microbacterium kribbense TaxID=433645 RepID=A0ABP7GMD0_9MICO